MKNLFLFIVAGCASASFAQAPDLTRLDVVQKALPDGPVALVDNVPIRKEDFLLLYDTQLAAAKAQLHNQVTDSVRVKTGLACLRELVERELLAQEAKRRGFKVSDEEVEKRYAAELKELQSALKKDDNSAPSEAEILSKSGQTKQGAREELRKTLLVEKVRDAISKEKGAGVSDKQAQDFMKENPQFFEKNDKMHLHQIFVRPKPNANKATPEEWDAAHKKLEKAIARIKAGETFDAVAKDTSDSPDKDKGGDMGMANTVQLPTFYVDAARKLKPGELSDIIKSEHGLHLVRLDEVQAGQEVNKDAALPKVKESLAEASTQSAVAAWTQNIVNDPRRVQIYLQLDPALAALARDDASPDGAAGNAPKPASAAKAAPKAKGRK